MSKTTYVVSTQKGGAGKTTLTVLVASYLHYVKGYKVAVVDCDYPQFSIDNMRKRDKKATIEDPFYNRLAYEQMKRLNEKSYPVVPAKAGDAMEIVERIKAQPPGLVYVFFDMPGTVNSRGVIDTIAQMDYIFMPIVADRVVMESSMKFATIISENIISLGKGSVKGIFLLWNKVDARENSEVYKQYENGINTLALPLLKTRLPDSKRFRKETATKRKAVFRSTVFPMDKVLMRDSGVDIYFTSVQHICTITFLFCKISLKLEIYF